MMIIDAMVVHHNRCQQLLCCVGSLHSQALAPREVYVLDDSSPMVKDTEFEFARQHVRFVPVNFEFLGGRPQWSRKMNGGREEIEHRCHMFGFPEPDALVILSCDFVLDPIWLMKASECSGRHPKALIVSPAKNRIDEKARSRGGLVVAGHEVVLDRHDWADNGMCWFVPWKSWRPWDEDFDKIGFGHQVPEWLYRMHKEFEFVRCDDLVDEHVDHASYEYISEPERLRQVEMSERLYRSKIGG